MKEILIKKLQDWLIVKTFLWDFEVINSGWWTWWTSIVKDIKINWVNGKLVIKFLLENISKIESENFKRFKQAYINLLLLKSNNYIIPQFYFGELILDDNNTVPYIIMHKANKSKLEVASDFEDFEIKFTQLLDCIQFIHDNWIIHRDIKPQNIFEYDWKIVLWDFDISSFSDIKLVHTDKWDRLANYHFSSPEQSNNKIWKICEKSDWYAFWQILHYLIIWNALRGQDEIDIVWVKWIEYKKYQELIKKLIQEKQQNRLGSKDEILHYLKEFDEHEKKNQELLRKKKSKEKEKNLLDFFLDIILKYSNTVSQWFQIIIKKSIIISLLKDINKGIELEWTNFLWYNKWIWDDNITSIIQKRGIFWFLFHDNIWIFNNVELNIDKIYVYKKNWLPWENFLIIETKKQKPTWLYDWEYEYEEYWLYKWIVKLTRTEFDNWYKEFLWKKVDISRETELRVRILEKTIYFILPRWLLDKNEDFFREFYEKCKQNNTIITEEMFDIFNDCKFRRYKPWES